MQNERRAHLYLGGRGSPHPDLGSMLTVAGADTQLRSVSGKKGHLVNVCCSKQRKDPTRPSRSHAIDPHVTGDIDET